MPQSAAEAQMQPEAAFVLPQDQPSNRSRSRLTKEDDDEKSSDSSTAPHTRVRSSISDSEVNVDVGDDAVDHRSDDSHSCVGVDDPFFDVRDKMEALCLEDRDRRQAVGSRCHEPAIPLFAACTTYLGFAILIAVGHISDMLSAFFRSGRYLAKTDSSHHPSSDDERYYASLLKSWENFYTRRIYHRIQDCFNRPIASKPGATIYVLERISHDGNKTMDLLGPRHDLAGHFDPHSSHNTNQPLDNKTKMLEEYVRGPHYCEVSDNRVARKCLNLGSYNYLGFADDWDVTCKDQVLSSLNYLPISSGSSRIECGTTVLHEELEDLVAEFLGREAALVLNMGFNTNCTTISALMEHGDLLISNKLNHSSVVNGARASGAAIRTFRHNDANDLEEILREAIVMGRPRTRRPWNKIMVIVEGIYSMEGEYCDMKNVVRVAKKYGAYVYLDEAHSIGAIGLTGRGCCEYTGVDFSDVDVLMGTFSKSFAGMGGYIASSREVIDFLKERCSGSAYHNSLSPVVCQQVISCFKVIMGRDGTSVGRRKISALRDNSNYFRMRLSEMGLHVVGNYDSPVVPVMLYNTTKIAAFSRECLKRGIAIVAVGFPAVPVYSSRARFCLSAGHTRKDLDQALKEIDEVADILKLRYARSTFG